ncbi:hypothetical protein TL16_g02181 [Triparma laevis f. inornata]|uniref:Uncharacterized protein n=2 Tax=Triparma laevis TaxID=1534972 RepID=A0A9W7FEE3_9STRA|nr:hypothetical protein TL16_g02181 [Triparma laevis f. inornata]GMI10678.1 hypothetical protein TrLO_g9012 [Triparma laevis f. longispina]
MNDRLSVFLQEFKEGELVNQLRKILKESIGERSEVERVTVGTQTEEIEEEVEEVPETQDVNEDNEFQDILDQMNEEEDSNVEQKKKLRKRPQQSFKDLEEDFKVRKSTTKKGSPDSWRFGGEEEGKKSRGSRKRRK